VCGPLDAAARRHLAAELDAERHAAVRLGALRALLDKIPAASPVVAHLERDGAFVPTSPTELAS
jgi:hypothetical protein